MKNISQKAPALLVIIAFAVVYIVWGSTFFFIRMAVQGFPPMLMGAMRFITAGLILLTWCKLKGDKLWVKKDVINSGVSGILLLFVATGIVIWVEQTLPSAIVAITIAAEPVWLVLMDKGNWRSNFRNRSIIGGLIIGFAGVILLFGEQLRQTLGGHSGSASILALILLLLGPIAWCAGSLYSKNKNSNSPARVNTAWQMLIGGMAFIPASFARHEFTGFSFQQVPAQAWMAMIYLVIFGSIAAYSAYIWLLQVRPATQVSTHSYVNPVIAVLLGVMFAAEHISALQMGGLVIILLSVLLINLDKYREAGKHTETTPVIPMKGEVLEAC
ncbi:MAG TPA: EamA family transporter [Mucilaginibacter sp.]